jgi:hypothetical protein
MDAQEDFIGFTQGGNSGEMQEVVEAVDESILPNPA